MKETVLQLLSHSAKREDLPWTISLFGEVCVLSTVDARNPRRPRTKCPRECRGLRTRPTHFAQRSASLSGFAKKVIPACFRRGSIKLKKCVAPPDTCPLGLTMLRPKEHKLLREKSIHSIPSRSACVTTGDREFFPFSSTIIGYIATVGMSDLPLSD